MAITSLTTVLLSMVPLSLTLTKSLSCVLHQDAQKDLQLSPRVRSQYDPGV